ncbi:MAG: XdhC family protein [Desulfurococcaceae archaeon TW002]
MGLPKNITDEEFIHFAGEKLSKGLKVAAAVVVRKEGSGPRDVGSKILVCENGEVYGTLGGGFFERHVVQEALKALAEGKPRIVRYSFTGHPIEGAVDTGLICGGILEVFIDVFKPTQRVVIFGTGRVGKPLGDLLNFLGFKIVVADPNAELVSAELYPYADTRAHIPVDQIEEKLPGLIAGGDVVFITHGEVEVDYKALKTLLRTNVKFVGLLGSKRKITEFVKRLLQEGVDKEVIRKKFRGPVGADIPADTPEEIAVSIVTELITLLKGGRLKTLNIVEEVLDQLGISK